MITIVIATAIKPQQEFEIFSSEVVKSADGNDELILEGVASTTNMDLMGDIVTNEAIESMKNQATGVNIVYRHREGFFDTIGVIKEIIPSDTKLKIKFKIFDDVAERIKSRIEEGGKYGLSIRGFPTKFESIKDAGKKIKDIFLREISLTPMPVNWDTFGTVEISKELVQSNCLSGACHHIIKNIQKEDSNMTNEENNLTKEEVATIAAEAATNAVKETMKEFQPPEEPPATPTAEDKIAEAFKGLGETMKENNETLLEAIKGEQPPEETPEEKQAREREELKKEVKAELIKEYAEKRNPNGKFDKFKEGQTEGGNPSNEDNKMSNEEIAKELIEFHNNNNPLMAARKAQEEA